MLKKLITKVRKNKKGFTLIELIVVIAILGILAAILIPSVTNIVNTAQTNTDKANAKTAYMQAQVLIANNPTTAYTGATLATAVKTAANIPSDATVTITLTSGAVTAFSYTPRSGATAIPQP